MGGNEAFLNEQRGLKAFNPLSCLRFSCGVVQLGPLCSQQSFFFFVFKLIAPILPPKKTLLLALAKPPSRSQREAGVWRARGDNGDKLRLPGEQPSCVWANEAAS